MTSISAASSASQQLPSSNDSAAIRGAFGQLTSALQSGDLSSAQSAYTTLSQAAGSDPNNPLSSALQQIGTALQSGDLGQAQQALSQLQQQMQASHGHHHHHGGGGGKTQAADNPATPVQSSDPSGATGNVVDVTA
jgi:thioredoxin-like negative regulator of GroEL